MNAMHRSRAIPGVARRQSGVSLLVVLILLVVMSVLGLAVLRSSAMQERMSANMYDRNLAQQAAEAALVAAQDYLNDEDASGANWQVVEPTAATCASNSVCPPFTTGATWLPGPTLGADDASVPDTESQYWIEYLGMNQAHMEAGGVIPASDTTSMGPLFRITARSAMPGRANVTLQTDVIYRLPRL